MSEPTRIPVVFIHGLWMHSTTWDSWISLFGERGYEGIAPGWPGEAPAVEAARANPDAVANVGIAAITDHYANIIGTLPAAPIVVGHSFGGLIAQRLLGLGLARGGVVLSPAQFRGNFKLPPAQLKTASPVLSKPSNRTKAVSQTPKQFHAGFANAVTREESDDLHERFMIPSPALPLFQAAFANFSKKTEANVDVARERGPLLIIGASEDRTVPAVTSRAASKQYAKNPSVTEYEEFEGRSHSYVIDQGWADVANLALGFLGRQGLGASSSVQPSQL